MGMKNPIPTYTYLISQLRERHPNLAYIHIIQSRDLDNPKQSSEVFHDLWLSRLLIVTDGFTREKALTAAKCEGILVAFGRHFISNVSGSIDMKYKMYGIDRSLFFSRIFPSDWKVIYHCLHMIGELSMAEMRLERVILIMLLCPNRYTGCYPGTCRQFWVIIFVYWLIV